MLHVPRPERKGILVPAVREAATPLPIPRPHCGPTSILIAATFIRCIQGIQEREREKKNETTPNRLRRTYLPPQHYLQYTHAFGDRLLGISVTKFWRSKRGTRSELVCSFDLFLTRRCGRVSRAQGTERP